MKKITALHAAGDIAAAADALRAFRATVPDADRHLPESLREWAGSVPMTRPVDQSARPFSAGLCQPVTLQRRMACRHVAGV